MHHLEAGRWWSGEIPWDVPSHTATSRLRPSILRHKDDWNIMIMSSSQQWALSQLQSGYVEDADVGTVSKTKVSRPKYRLVGALLTIEQRTHTSFR